MSGTLMLRMAATPMPLFIPNLHVALIHFPIALLLLGTAGEIVCWIAYRASGARAAARWMILFGAALGWPALYSGVSALRQVAGADFDSWADLRAGSPVLSNAASWETLRTHLLLNAAATTLASVVVVVWLMAGERTRRVLHVPGVVLLLGATALILIGAWNGGELVYWHEVTAAGRSSNGDPQGHRPIEWNVRAIVPPLDAHVTMAGATTALCLLAWGVAARSRSVTALASSVEPVDADASAQRTASTEMGIDRIYAAFQSATVEAAVAPPRATLGWLASVAGVATAALGVWVLADAFESRSPKVLWAAILDRDNAVGGVSRRLAHLIAGTTVLALPLVVGWAGSRARSGRLWPLMIGVVLLAAIAAQAWLGVLLLLDGNAGAITGWRP